MDLFATLSSIAFDTSDSEPATATPIDVEGGDSESDSAGCIVA